MVCTSIYSFSALEGKYLEPPTSSHPIKAEGYEIHLDFISLVKELDFARGFNENPYKHLQDFEEICATLMILGMNHETLKWKAFPFPLTGWAKQWYKLHVSSCHGSWVILKDQFCFAFFLLSKIIDLRNEVEEVKTISDRILSVTPLDDLQIKAPLISEEESIITYLDASDISASLASEELLQLTALRICSENKIEDPTPFPLKIEEDCFDNNIGNLLKAPTCDLKGLEFEPAGQDLEEFIASKDNLL
jgi:hypothetical protein